MDFLPLFHNLRGRTVLVVGGGEIAYRKIKLVMSAGAQLRVVATSFIAPIDQILKGTDQKINRPFQEDDVSGCALVVAATNDQNLNEHISKTAQIRQIPVNVVDNPELCSVIFPSIVDRSPLMLAISTGGQAPVLARWIRTWLESHLSHGYKALATFMGEKRNVVKNQVYPLENRRYFWEAFLNGPIKELLLSGRLHEAKQQFNEMLCKNDVSAVGEVYLVGAGPGDPDLLTFKALRLMQQADVVLYDNLVSEPILQLCRRDATMEYVGKKQAQHALPQLAINQRLVDLALEGKRVLRLKGGDPFVFGRGGEEIDQLSFHRIPFQVVPGISAANGCAAYAGIPLTHRDHAQSVRFLTGHFHRDDSPYPWSDLGNPNETLVFYMALSNLKKICQTIVEQGRSKDTPVAIIESGTLPNQKIWKGTLASIDSQARQAGAKSPTLMIVGTVVQLQSQMSWHFQTPE